jgi:membrane-associated phospholipid phosphatase
MVLYEAWRRQRRFFWVALPMNVGLIVSTVACRFHYGIDLIAAVPLAVVSLWLGAVLARAPWKTFSWSHLARVPQGDRPESPGEMLGLRRR